MCPQRSVPMLDRSFKVLAIRYTDLAILMIAVL